MTDKAKEGLDEAVDHLLDAAAAVEAAAEVEAEDTRTELEKAIAKLPVGSVIEIDVDGYRVRTGGMHKRHGHDRELLAALNEATGAPAVGL